MSALNAPQVDVKSMRFNKMGEKENFYTTIIDFSSKLKLKMKKKRKENCN